MTFYSFMNLTDKWADEEGALLWLIRHWWIFLLIAISFILIQLIIWKVEQWDKEFKEIEKGWKDE